MKIEPESISMNVSKSWVTDTRIDNKDLSNKSKVVFGNKCLES